MEDKIINLQERVTVYATAEAPHHKVDEEVKCSPAVADKMIENGWATKEKGAKAHKTKKEAV